MKPLKNLLRKKSKKGSILVLVIIVSTILWISIIYSISAMNSSRMITVQSVEHERALMLAQSGLSQGLEWLNVQGTPPSTDTTMASNQLSNPNSSNYDLDVKVYPQTLGALQLWTVSSTAAYKVNTGTSEKTFNRRVQATVFQENFARYEQFIDQADGPVYSSPYYYFYGFNQVLFGPFHCNSAMALWPNIWFCDESTGAAPGGIVTYPNFSAYQTGVQANVALAKTKINILNYYSTTYKFQPKFYKGLQVVAPISIPTDLNLDTRSDALKNNAGFRLPADVATAVDPVTSLPVYLPAKGSKWVIKAVDPSSANGDGTIQVRQYRGKDSSNNPIYGPTVTKAISDINGAMIVTGDIESLQGTIDGKLTIGAFKTSANSGDGNVKVDGNLEYQSRKANTNFKYSDAPELFTNSGADVDLPFVDTLKAQVTDLDDILGIVCEKEVVIPRYDLTGAAVGASKTNSLNLDCIVMATGSSTSSATDGSFYPEDMLNRYPGVCHRLGGMVQAREKSWALYSGSTFQAGLDGPSIWDFRSVTPGGAPPFFPTTGVFTYYKNSWRETYVADVADAPVLPN